MKLTFNTTMSAAWYEQSTAHLVSMRLLTMWNTRECEAIWWRLAPREMWTRAMKRNYGSDVEKLIPRRPTRVVEERISDPDEHGRHTVTLVYG